MRKLMLVLAVGLVSLPTLLQAQEKPYGIDKRVPWTTSRVVGTPDPPPPMITRPTFTKLKFFEPLEMLALPGSDRLVIVERPGKVFTFKNNPDVPAADLFMDIKKTTYGLAFHPKFAENGFVFATYLVDPSKPSASGTRLVRYQAKPGNPPTCDAATEKLILEWPSGGHNGGCLRFGPDGYLYIVTGDGSGIADELQTGQDVTDLLASILRVDVDKPADGKGYGIPKDNPFASGEGGARPEIWAYGLRQAWKIAFDLPTGDLWAGEVGQDLWEMVLLIQRGGNYGWSIQEGAHPFRPERKLGPSPILRPVVEHNHAEFRSITGGYVYRGKKHLDLVGTYVYGDYDTGKIWHLNYDAKAPAGKQVTVHKELADTALRIVCWGEDHQGELYLVDFIGGGIHQLMGVPPRRQTDFPRKLSETGLFASVKDHTPAAGLIPYSVNAPLWSDHAEKERFLALPGLTKIEYNAIEYPQPAPGAPRGWRFPDGTVAVKTFSLELEPGKRKRIETRLLHVEQTPGTQEVGDQVWRGYTYLWNDDQTEATLLEGQQGLDREYTVADPKAPGGMRKQIWHFPSRTECTLCHTTPAKYVLGLNTLQMNKDHNYGAVTDNQLRTLNHLGVFTAPLPEKPEKLPKLADYRDPQTPLDQRARAYLHSNCAHCHMKWGGGNAEFQLLATLEVKDTGTLGIRPAHGLFNLTDPKLLVAGEPERSMIYHRMTKLGLGRMPHIASTVVDQEAVRLVAEWIKGLPK